MWRVRAPPPREPEAGVASQGLLRCLQQQGIDTAADREIAACVGILFRSVIVWPRPKQRDFKLNSHSSWHLEARQLGKGVWQRESMTEADFLQIKVSGDLSVTFIWNWKMKSKRHDCSCTPNQTSGSYELYLFVPQGLECHNDIWLLLQALVCSFNSDCVLWEGRAQSRASLFFPAEPRS